MARPSALSTDFFGSHTLYFGVPNVPLTRSNGVTYVSPVKYSVVPSCETLTTLAALVLAWGFGTRIVGPAVSVSVSIEVIDEKRPLTGSWAALPTFATHAVLPPGVIAIEYGWNPTGIAGPAVFVARSMGVTEFAEPFATYAFAVSGVMAIAVGPAPTGIAAPGVPVARSIGVTVSSA